MSTARRAPLRPALVLLAFALVLAGTLVSAPAEAASVKHTRLQAFRIAKAQAGDDYRWGGNGPDAFDCSGLTSFAYAHAGRAIPRTSRDQVAATRPIPESRAKKGDFVFFHRKGRVYHVGIYAGKHRMWHAPGKGQQVRRDTIWGTDVFFGRLLRR